MIQKMFLVKHKSFNFLSHYVFPFKDLHVSVSADNSPVALLVQIPTALCAVLLVALWLVQTVGGALPHL